MIFFSCLFPQLLGSVSWGRLINVVDFDGSNDATDECRRQRKKRQQIHETRDAAHTNIRVLSCLPVRVSVFKVRRIDVVVAVVGAAFIGAIHGLVDFVWFSAWLLLFSIFIIP